MTGSAPQNWNLEHVPAREWRWQSQQFLSFQRLHSTHVAWAPSTQTAGNRSTSIALQIRMQKQKQPCYAKHRVLGVSGNSLKKFTEMAASSHQQLLNLYTWLRRKPRNTENLEPLLAMWPLLGRIILSFSHRSIVPPGSFLVRETMQRGRIKPLLKEPQSLLLILALCLWD